MVDDIYAAFSFLTIIPAPKVTISPERLGRAVGMFPLVGVVLGGLLTAIAASMNMVFPPRIGAVILLAVWVFMTGALHLDGFLDACDGLFGGQSPETRLAIMRDERVGAFALAGGVLLLLAKYSALVTLLSSVATPAFSFTYLSHAVTELAPPLILAPLLGRFAMTFAIVRFPYGRPSGLGLAMKAGASYREIIIAAIITLITVLGLVGITGLLLWGGTVLAVWLIARWVETRIPGLTGDVYGAICELIEMGLLIVWGVL